MIEPSPQLAAVQEHTISLIAGSVGIGLITSYLELTAFFTLSSCMLLMLCVPPFIQWILCDGPSLARRDELFAYMNPWLCFTLTYLLPWLVASAICQTTSAVMYMWGWIIWHLSVFWLFHTWFLLKLWVDPDFGPKIYDTTKGLLADVIYLIITSVTTCYTVASYLENKMVTAQKRLMEARMPVATFIYKVDVIRNKALWMANTAGKSKKFKLLKLSRRNPFSEITCRLEEFPLDDAPIYEAISYRWGDSKERKEIIVNDLRFPLSHKAYDVLQGRSSLFRSRWLWIDAICIDQGNEEDKTQQVDIMGKIYQKASRTVIWLESPNLSRYEIRTTLNLIHMITIASLGIMMSFDRLRKDFMESNRPGRGPGRWRGLNNLLRHEWFGRVWMVQEVVVAKKVHAIYGGAYIDWGEFTVAIAGLRNTEMSAVVWSAGETSTIAQTGAPLAISHTAIMATLRERFHRNETITLKNGLLACARFDATMAVDKIYSLNFITDKIDKRLKADYGTESKEKKSVEDLYTDVAEYLLDKDYVTDILTLAGIGHSREHNTLPSWVVDWSNVPELLEFSGGSENVVYRASGTSLSSAPLTASRGRITLRGCKVDVISRLGPALMHDSKSEENSSQHVKSIHNIFNFYREAALLAESSKGNESEKDSFRRTIIGDRVWVNGQRSQAPVAPDECELWNHNFQILTRIAESGAFEHVFKSGNPWIQASNAEQLISHLQITLSLMPLGLTPDDLSGIITESYKLLPSKGMACTNRMFCITEEGKLALVPPHTKEHDIVVIPLGAQTPFIMRKHIMERHTQTGRTRSVYKLVGECYVHGMMSGEMMDCNLTEEDFILE